MEHSFSILRRLANLVREPGSTLRRCRTDPIYVPLVLILSVTKQSPPFVISIVAWAPDTVPIGIGRSLSLSRPTDPQSLIIYVS